MARPKISDDKSAELGEQLPPTAMFLHWSIEQKRSGVENAAFLRARLFEEQLGIIPQILTLAYDPHFADTHAELLRQGFISNNVIFRNIYEFFQQEECLPQVAGMTETSLPPGWRCVDVSGTPDIRVEDEHGRLVMYRRHSRSTRKLEYINHFRDGRKWRRDTYWPHGVLSRTQFLNPQSYEIENETYFRPDGSVAILQRYSSQNRGHKISAIRLHNHDGDCVREFSSHDAFVTYWLDHCTDDTATPCVLIVDRNRFFFQAVRQLKQISGKEHVFIVPVIHSTHIRGNADPRHSPAKSTYAGILDDLSWPHAVVVGTQRQEEHIRHRYGPGNLHVIPPACNLGVSPHNTSSAPRNLTRLICLGRYSAEKNQIAAIRTFSHIVRSVPDATLDLYGHGRDQQMLQAEVATLGLKDCVRVNSFVTDVASVYRSAGLFVLTSIEEGYPLVVIESLSNGCPVAAFDVNYGPADMIRDGQTGILVPFGEEELLASRIVEILRDPERHQQMCVNALEASRYFDGVAVAEKWKQLLASLNTRHRSVPCVPTSNAVISSGDEAPKCLDLSVVRFLDSLRHGLLVPGSVQTEDLRTLLSAAAPRLPLAFWGFAITLYQPGVERLVVVRVGADDPLGNVARTLERVPQHARFHEFDLADWNRCRVQVDFILEEPVLTDFSQFSESALPDDCDAASKRGLDGTTTAQLRTEEQATPGEDYLASVGAAWQVQFADWISTIGPQRRRIRFEFGVDGLQIAKGTKRRYFFPGDAFVRSILGLGQLRRHIQRLFPGDKLDELTCSRFRSLSFVSGLKSTCNVSDRDTTGAIQDAPSEERGSWLPLYRGLPPIPEVCKESLAGAARAGTQWIANNLQDDGRFIYYYDAATDTQRDHEHPDRDPATNPYYNLLRHSGGLITLLLDELLWQAQEERGPASGRAGSAASAFEVATDAPIGTSRPSSSAAQRRRVIEQASDFLVQQLVDYRTTDGQEAAYALYNRKAKLGGSGTGLCVLAMYQRVFNDNRYARIAARLANHLCNEINDQGEFRYYHIYLDKPVRWEDNQRYFSFYYPGEAILGLSQFCQHACDSDAARRRVFDKTHHALRFLFRERPHLHKEHYQTLPSDSWLMMAINDLWDVPEFRLEEYKKFVFDDADQMVRLMYTHENAIYPDYVGSFYYHYGDHPYPDGARAEGLLGAYQLAVKVQDQERIERYGKACHAVAAATLRLCNTPDSVYSAANPALSIGGIRFKLTRQWFRVDTIQHVASFYLKLLTHDVRIGGECI